MRVETLLCFAVRSNQSLQILMLRCVVDAPVMPWLQPQDCFAERRTEVMRNSVGLALLFMIKLFV
ncbi:unnamed protein product, partial [Musa acuminata var. zebrina]